MELDNMSINNLPSPFDIVPLHVIEHILGYLDMYDLLSVSLTCRQWYTASKHPKLRKRINFSIEETTLPVDMILSSMRIYENIKLYHVPLGNRELKFFQQYGMNIKQFTIIGESERNFPILIQILNCLPSLETLELLFPTDETDFLKMFLDEVPEKGLPNLKKFRFCRYLFVSRKSTIKLFKVIPNLEEFIVHGFTDYPLDCLNFVNNYKSTLKTLHITSLDYQTKYLIKPGQVILDGLDLNDLHINCLFENNKEMLQFILSQKNLTKLKITELSLNFHEIKLICDNLHKLESFQCDNNGLPSESINQLKNLKALYLQSYLDEVEVVNLRDAISSKRNKTLQVLHLRIKRIIENTQTYLSLIVNLTNLRELRIEFNIMEDDLFQLIFKYLLNLENLEINWNHAARSRLNYFKPSPPRNSLTTDTELYDIGRLSKLKKLKLNFSAEQIPGFSIEHLMQLKNLTSLTIFVEMQPQITTADQIRLMQSLPLLEDVNFEEWNGIERRVILANGPRLNKRCKHKLSKITVSFGNLDNGNLNEEPQEQRINPY